MTHPYSALPPSAFWRTAVADKNPLQVSGLWAPKFPIRPTDRIITAGSCFAQHIGRALSARGYAWHDGEPCPPWLSPQDGLAYNYGVFSFRTGNIYTAAALRQWLELAFEAGPPVEEWWHGEGRVFDPLRPAIEPGGFASVDEAAASRRATLAAIRGAVDAADLFVFTLGLTEGWYNLASGVEYAMCPGTLAGSFDSECHGFRNHRHAAILTDMQASLELLRRHNPDIRVLLTVSPVPLTATASGRHVLAATSYSKSVLRAVAGDLADSEDRVDYFPSYEIITHPIFRGMFYAPNQRDVVPEGVDIVMKTFFGEQAASFGGAEAESRRGAVRAERAAWRRARLRQDVKCEEEMLNAFAR